MPPGKSMIFFKQIGNNGNKNVELVGTDLVSERAVVPAALDFPVGSPTRLDFDVLIAD